jgi:hypothetical protein
VYNNSKRTRIVRRIGKGYTMRGRKAQPDAKRKTITIRISEEDYKIYSSNPDIKNEIKKQVSNYLKLFRA